MKALLCGMFFLAVTGMAMAQMPMQNGPGALPAPGMPMSYGQSQAPTSNLYGLPQAQAPITYGQPQIQAPVMHTYGMPATSGASCGPTPCCSPAPTCCEPCKTCERVPSTRPITHVFYCKTCEEFCVPKCHCCLSSLFGCGGCCDGPWAKYYLVKRVRIEDCPTTKCVPAVAPVCGGCPIPAAR